MSRELGRDEPVVGCLIGLDDVAEHLAAGVCLQLCDGTQTSRLGIKHLIGHGLAHVVVHDCATVAHLQSERDVAVTVAHSPCADAVDDERIVALKVVGGRHLAWREVGSLPRQYDDIIVAHTFSSCWNGVERHLDGHLRRRLVVTLVGIVVVDDDGLILIIFLVGDGGWDVEDVVHRLTSSNCLSIYLVGKQTVLHQTHLIVAHAEAALVADGDNSLGCLAGRHDAGHGELLQNEIVVVLVVNADGIEGDVAEAGTSGLRVEGEEDMVDGGELVESQHDLPPALITTDLCVVDGLQHLALTGIAVRSDDDAQGGCLSRHSIEVEFEDGVGGCLQADLTRRELSHIACLTRNDQGGTVVGIGRDAVRVAHLSGKAFRLLGCPELLGLRIGERLLEWQFVGRT